MTVENDTYVPEAERDAAFDAAVAVLREADFRLEGLEAWAEPGDTQVAGFDVMRLVTAALAAAARVRQTAPVPEAQSPEIERLREAGRTAGILIHSLVGDEDDEATQAAKLLAWSTAATAAETNRPAF